MPKVEPGKEPEVIQSPVEYRCLNDGIIVSILGDQVQISMNAYMAEHIGQHRRIDRVVIRFKGDGKHPPDIMATQKDTTT